MLMTTAGQIGIDLILNGTSFKKSLNNIQTKANIAGSKIAKSLSGVQSQANIAGSKISNSFSKIAKVVGTAFSVAMITRFGKSCIDLGSDLTEVQNVVDVTFKNMSSSVDKWAKQSQSQFGLSETMAKKYVGTFGSMAEAFGFSEKQAYNMSTALTGLAGDVASFYNISQDEAYTKLKSVFSGETETLKDLGVVMTQNALDAYALANGYGKTTSAMTEAEKVSLRFAFVQDQLKNATGDFARTQDSWANQTRILQLRFESLKATLGQGLINVFAPVLKLVNALILRVGALADKFKEFTDKVFGNAGSSDTSNSLDSAAKSTSNLTNEANNSSKAIDKVSKSAKKAKSNLASFDKLNVLTKTDSSTSSGGTVSTPTTGGNTSSNKKPSTSNKNKPKFNFSKLYEESGLKNFFDKVQRGIDKVDWSAIGENCKNIFKKSIPIAKAYLGQVQNVSKSALGAVGSFIGGIVQVSGKQLQTLTGGISKWLTKDQGKIIGFINTIGTHLSNGFDNLSTFFDGAFDLLGDSIDRVRPTMETAISDLLSGCTDLAGGIGTIVSDSFEIATGKLVEWIENDSETIGTFFDNVQLQIADVLSFVGTVFSEIGTYLSDWWESDGSSVFSNICSMFTNIGTTLMNVYNEWIKPAWDAIVDIFQSAWDDCLKPIFEKAVSFFGKLGDCISAIWNNFLSPIVNFLVKTFGPVFTNIFNAIGGVFKTVFTVIGDVVGGILDALGGLLDFITGIFTGDWEKAWNGIKDFFKGIWDGIWGIIKGVINLIIDGINMLWTGIYNAVSAIVNAVGGIAGAIGDVFGQDWNFSMPEKVPLIPKLAKGGLVKAPTLAVVGDNMGASSGNPEVVSPLNKLKGMIQESSDNGDTEILSQILLYLKRMYEMFIIFRNKGGNTYEFVAKINGSDIFKEIVKQNEMYKKRHNGKSAFV